MGEYYFSLNDIIDKAIGTDAYFQIKSILTSTKPADVAPVQHGRWEKWNGDNRHHCTVCECYANAERDAYGYITSEFLDNYCPNCGAIMATE